MDKEEQQRELQNQALAGYKGRSGDIYQATAERNRKVKLDEEKRKNEQALFLERFEKLVGDIDNLLTNTETQLYETIQRYEAELEKALKTASRTEDGRIVFRDKDGNIHAHDGEALTEEEIASIRWNPDACGQENIQFITQTLGELHAMNERVFVMRNRFDDIKDDPTPENLKELEGVKGELQEINDYVANSQSKLITTNHADASVIKHHVNEEFPDMSLPQNQL